MERRKHKNLKNYWRRFRPERPMLVTYTSSDRRDADQNSFQANSLGIRVIHDEIHVIRSLLETLVICTYSDDSTLTD